MEISSEGPGCMRHQQWAEYTEALLPGHEGSEGRTGLKDKPLTGSRSRGKTTT